LPASTTKKAVVRRYQRETLAGYVNPLSYLQPAGVELLSEAGNVSTIPYDEIKTVAFVRDFESPGSPERLAFLTRPKMAGLWVSFRFRDGEVLEGILPNNLLPIDPHGFVVIPPDPNGNQQRIFVPRQAVLAVEVLGVVGSPLRKRKPAPVSQDQIRLFDE
jgi:hypothetical protein